MDRPIPLARPALGPREEALVVEVLRSGRLSLGPMVERFEDRLARVVGAPDAVAVSSGTAALHLGVRALGWGPGDRVLTTPLSFVASANCLLYEGVEPVFCDVDPVTLNLDPEAVEAAVDPRSRGILPVDLFGHPADMPALRAIADRNDLGILDDACEALGSVDASGTPVGGAGVLTTFAFYANKQITTGEGGVIVPRDREEAARLRSERNQGRAPDMAWLSHDRLGFNYRMSEIAAAIGLGQLERIGELLHARAGVARLYSERLAGCDWLELPPEPDPPAHASRFVYVVRLAEGIDRDETIRGLARRGVEAKGYLPPIHLFPHYRERLGHGPGDFPVAERVARTTLALPFHAGLEEDDVDRVARALAEAVGRPVPA